MHFLKQVNLHRNWPRTINKAPETARSPFFEIAQVLVRSRDSAFRSCAESGINLFLMKRLLFFSSCLQPLRAVFTRVIRFHSS
jgi:hypothetical protein